MTTTGTASAVAADPRLLQRAASITERELAAYTRAHQAFAGGDRAGPQGPPARRPVELPGLRPASDRRRATRPGRTWSTSTATEYIDFDMGFGALFAGHVHPAVRAAVEAQLDDGTLYVTPVRARTPTSPSCSPSATACRCGGSPTPAPRRRWTPIRVARGATGRDEDRQGRGRLPRPPRRGDDLDEAAARPPPARPTRPTPVPATAGITRGVLADTIVIPYNDPDALERALAGGDVACLHRRAGDGEHRHLPARRRLPPGGPRHHRRDTARCSSSTR